MKNKTETPYNIDKNNNERAVAIEILLEITEQGAYNNIALSRTLIQKTDWQPYKKAFVTELVNGTLRNLILIDNIIERFSTNSTNAVVSTSTSATSATPTKTAKKKPPKTKPFIRELLRTAIYQILFMDKVPHSAAVNEAVNLAKKQGFASLSGFINGILRNIVRNHATLLAFYDNQKPFSKYLALRYSLPPWLAERLIAQFGEPTAEEFCKKTHNPPPVAICTNLLKTDRTTLKIALEQQGVVCEEVPNNETCLNVRKTAQIGKIPQFKQGHFFVMDSDAYDVVYSLVDDIRRVQNNANSENHENHENHENSAKLPQILDLCAAPGGKSFALAGLLQNTGNITACDIYPHKVELIAKTSARLGTTCITPTANDALKFNADWQNKFDIVLLDAPCSGLATIRRRPDIKYTKTEKDVQKLAQIQRKMLTNAAKYVKPGGTLLYSTCTITPEENGDNLQWFLEEFPFENTFVRQADLDFGFYLSKSLRKD